MDLVVYGLMRSGTTLICDLLSVPGRSLVFSEPYLLDPWPGGKVNDVHDVARAFGLPVGDGPPAASAFDGKWDVCFDQVYRPHLDALDFWGIKETHFHNWQDVLSRYAPAKLVLTVRDIRDVALSLLDYIHRVKLAFPGGKYMRDEAWVVARLRHDVPEIMALRRRPHLLIRYEDLSADAAIRGALAGYAGLDRLSSGTAIRGADARGQRSEEIEKHGDAVSGRSIGRYAKEPDGIRLRLANHIWRCLPEFSRAFGYPLPPDGKPAVPDGENGKAVTWRQVQNARWTGPAGFDPFFARRRARLAAAQNIRTGTKVLDLGCHLPVLRFLLPEGCGYVGVDDVAKPPLVTAGDWRNGPIPGADAADLIAVLGNLEHLDDLAGFLKTLHATGRTALVTYHATDDTTGIDRGACGWNNHLSRREFLAALDQSGFATKTAWTFDRHQSLFRLTPKP